MNTLEQPRTIQIAVPFGIPPISDELLAQLSNTIQPVVEREGKLHYIEPRSPRWSDFNFYPAVADEAVGLEPVTTLTTLHTYNAVAFFKPSIAEVLAQIPAGYIDTVVAFKVNHNTDRIDEWPDAERLSLRWGYHMATTILYTSAS